MYPLEGPLLNPKLGILGQASQDVYPNSGIQAKGCTTWDPNQEHQARIHIGKLLDFGAISYIPAKLPHRETDTPHIYIYHIT